MQKFPFKVFVGNSGFEPDVTEWLVLLLHIQEVPGTNLGHANVYK